MLGTICSEELAMLNDDMGGCCGVAMLDADIGGFNGGHRG